MIERHFVQRKVLWRLRAGVMAPCLDSLASELPTVNYSRKSIRRQLRAADASGDGLPTGDGVD